MQKHAGLTIASWLCLGMAGITAYADDAAIGKLSVERHVIVDWAEDPPHVNVCDGHYVLPDLSNITQENPVITGDSTTLLLTGESHLVGNVIVEEPGRRLFANEITLQRTAEGEITEGAALGGVLLEEDDFRVLGDKATLVFENNATTVYGAEYRWYARQARGNAAKAFTETGKPLYLYDASYTTCKPDDNLWLLKAKKVVLNDKTGRGESFHTQLRMKNMPVFYVPYFNFPIDSRRKTGFLTPEFRSSTRSGREVTAPFYFNLAPNYDATYTPHWMSDRGYQNGLQLRHLSSLHESEFNGQYIGHDRAFATFRDKKLASAEVPDPADPRRAHLRNASSERWLLNFSSRGHYGEHWRSALDFNEVSDDNYFVDFGANRFGEDERFLRRRAQADYFNQEFTARMLVQDYQTLQPFEASLVEEPYRIMPQLETFYYPFMNDYPFQFKNEAQVANFQHNSDTLAQDTPTTGQRYHVEPTLSFPRYRPYGYITPEFTFYGTYYDLDRSRADDANSKPKTVTRTLPAGSVDAGLFYERDITLFHKSYLQTLEPRAFYLYIPKDNQNDIPDFDTTRYSFTTSQLFRKNRFSSIDRINDANQVSLALTTRFYDQQLGGERFSATIGQIVYFRNRDVTLCDSDVDPSCVENEDPASTAKTSPVVANAYYRLSPYWSILADGRYDFHDSKRDLASGRFHYQRDNRHIVYIGGRYEQSGDLVEDPTLGDQKVDLIQSDIGFSWALNERLNVLGRWYYDLRNTYTADAYGGLEYENCCYAVRAGARRYLKLNTGQSGAREYDTEYFLQWIFKGLGGVGRSPVDYFTNNLPGYEDRFEVKK